MVENLDKKLLTHELQLGESLNHSVHHDRRADFSLMLAMLVDDVREQSQFKLPQTEVEHSSIDESSLRKFFQLPHQEKLALKSMAEINDFEQGQLIEQNLFASIRLDDALKPKPLAFRDDKEHIETSVLENTTLYCQKRTEQQLTPNKRMTMKANEWLRNVQDTIVQSHLIAV